MKTFGIFSNFYPIYVHRVKKEGRLGFKKLLENEEGKNFLYKEGKNELN